MNERRFILPENRGKVVFTVGVLQHIYAHAQISFWSKEAGGQLFSHTPELAQVNISLATGPYPQDKRSRWHFDPDVNKATDDRHSQFAQGLHSVGLWHTHPEATPTPSASDRVTTQQYLDVFQGEMDSFLLVILGNKGKPPNLAVWIATISKEKSWLRLDEL